MMNQTQKNEASHLISIIREQCFDWSKFTVEDADLQTRKSEYFWPQ